MKTRTATLLGWSLWGTCIVFLVAPSWLPGADRSLVESILLGIWIGIISGVGALIASRRSTNPIGWIMIAIGVLLAVGVFARDYAIYALLAHPESLPGANVMAWLSTWLTIPGLTLLLFFVLLFPDGRLPSRRWRRVAWASAIASALITIVMAITPGEIEGFSGTMNPIGIGALIGWEEVEWVLFISLGLIIVACAFASIGSQLVRLRRAQGVERQQVKWFAYASALTATAFIVGNFLYAAYFLTFVGLIGMPLAIGMAILKYHLYDIDLIIHRTLVYGALTAVLTLVYVAGVAGVGGLVRAATGQDKNNIVVAASTLAVAAIFRPARSRVQAFIDRSFFRRKYDAVRTLEHFSTRLREEIDLESLSRELLGVVQDTMQPAQISLWLREREGRTRSA